MVTVNLICKALTQIEHQISRLADIFICKETASLFPETNTPEVTCKSAVCSLVFWVGIKRTAQIFNHLATSLLYGWENGKELELVSWEW